MVMTEGVVLGYFVSSRGIQVDPNKIEVNSTLRIPQKQKYVKSFLGHVVYYRRFIKDFSKVAAPLFVLLFKYIEFDCTPTWKETFEALTKTLVLRGPNQKILFHIHTNAYNFVIVVVLGQKEKNLEYVIYYISKNLQVVELNYKVTKK